MLAVLSSARRVALSVLIVLGLAGGAGAVPFAGTPVAVNGGWVQFSFGDVGSGFGDQPFTFTLSAPGTLTVVDGFLAGDQFQIFDGPNLLGLTSAPGVADENPFDEWGAALGDARWSRGIFQLLPGSYAITGVVTASPFFAVDGDGSAALRVDVAAVPAPAALPLFALGLLGLAAARRGA